MFLEYSYSKSSYNYELLETLDSYSKTEVFRKFLSYSKSQVTRKFQSYSKTEFLETSRVSRKPRVIRKETFLIHTKKKFFHQSKRFPILYKIVDHRITKISRKYYTTEKFETWSK